MVMAPAGNKEDLEDKRKVTTEVPLVARARSTYLVTSYALPLETISTFTIHDDASDSENNDKMKVSPTVMIMRSIGEDERLTVKPFCQNLPIFAQGAANYDVALGLAMQWVPWPRR
ncbi:hypothetical protein Syun_004016 [Stephania yunnanensis]|uniref:Uncharacterized protein n=1 Tax=Stephania yunnanensis TaxID=152371 RepID=A0AAP0L5I3_9MAGN